MNIYTAQSFLDESIIAEKIENNDFVCFISDFDDDGAIVTMLVDGNHSYEAAKRTGNTPEFVKVENDYKTLEQYVTAFNDLSNPVNIETGRDLW